MIRITAALAIVGLLSVAGAEARNFPRKGKGQPVVLSGCLLISGTTTNCLLISGTTTNALLVQ